MKSDLFDGMVIFTQVIQSGSFSKAAEQTGHSTSYVSKEVSKLESRLATRLIHRTTRTISLTEEGQLFYQQCQQLVNDAEQAIQTLNLGQQHPVGTLKVSCPVTLGMMHLKPVVEEYISRYPDMQLDLELNDKHVDIIQEGIDLAIRATVKLEDSSLIARKMKRYKIYTVATPRYLKKFGVPKTPYELVQHQCICYSNHKHPSRWQFSHNNGDNISIDVPATFLCNNAEMELGILLADQGICRLPEFYIEKELSRGAITPLFSDWIEPDVDLFAIYPSKKHLSPKVRCFLDLLIAHFN